MSSSHSMSFNCHAKAATLQNLIKSYKNTAVYLQ